MLAGPSDQASIVLSSPIILYDHPELAPQSESTFFDALEIDELLSLRTMTLSDEEKREVRGTDPRAAALLREVDDMPPDLWERLHGTVRYLDSMTAQTPVRAEARARGARRPLVGPRCGLVGGPRERQHHDWRPGGPARDPRRPSTRDPAADAYDLFLAGHTATVAAVLHDVDGKQHLAVTSTTTPAGT